MQERKKFIRHLETLGQPLVLLQEGGWSAKDICFLSQDDFAGGLAIGEHLLAEGAKHFAMVVPKTVWPAMTERVAGVRRALGAKSLQDRLLIVTSADESYDAVQAALAATYRSRRRVDAIIGGNDQIAIAALYFVKERGLAVPSDVLVTGFNAFDAWRYSDPKLTTVHSHAYEMGRRASEVLLDRLKTGRFARRRILLPVELIACASSSRRSGDH